MTHTVEQLVNIGLNYHPHDKGETGPEKYNNPETERRRTAHLQARAKYGDWAAMLRRLEARFPDRQVANRSIFRQGPEPFGADLAYSGTLSLPVRSAKEQYRYLGFMASIVVPYYALYDCARLDRMDDVWDVRYQLGLDEQALAAEVGRELEIAFPGYSLMPEALGRAIVPGVRTAVKVPGEATIYDCLFSDDW